MPTCANRRIGTFAEVVARFRPEEEDGNDYSQIESQSWSGAPISGGGRVRVAALRYYPVLLPRVITLVSLPPTPHPPS